MLTHIYVKDLAIVSSLELELEPGMSALTGETGAGKSILIDALGLALGDKTDNAMIRTGSERAEISASFDLARHPQAKRWLESNGLDATVLRVDLQVKLATPLACIVLPAIILFFPVGGPPFPTSATTLLLSIALGVGWVLMSGAGASLGYGGALKPLLAGWGPVLVMAAFASYLGLHLRARGQPLSRLSRKAKG